MPTLPTNPHYVGDSGHVNDHNTIVTALSGAVYASGQTGTVDLSGATVKGAGLDLVYSSQITAATSSYSVSNCFSATYKNYRVVLENIGSNLDDGLFITFGANSHYGNFGYILYSSTTQSWSNTNNGAKAQVGLSEGSQDDACSTFDVISPNDSTKYTSLFGQCMGRGYYAHFGYAYAINSALTGFSVTQTSGQVDKGFIRVYGYRNS